MLNLWNGGRIFHCQKHLLRISRKFKGNISSIDYSIESMLKVWTSFRRKNNAVYIMGPPSFQIQKQYLRKLPRSNLVKNESLFHHPYSLLLGNKLRLHEISWNKFFIEIKILQMWNKMKTCSGETSCDGQWD